MRRLSNCGSRAQLLCGMWDLPRPGLEPVPPALAGRFSTTAPPGKPLFCFLSSIFPSLLSFGVSEHFLVFLFNLPILFYYISLCMYICMCMYVLVIALRITICVTVYLEYLTSSSGMYKPYHHIGLSIISPFCYT